MTKQEFLAMSLPYELKLQFKDREEKYCRKQVIGTLGGIYSDRTIVCHDTVNAFPTKFKPILHPLSDLAKEIVHKGEKFVPIVELASICYNNFFTIRPFFKEQDVLSEDNSFGFIGYTEEERITLTYVDKFNQNEFEFWISGNKMNIRIRQLMLFQKLIEWHFAIGLKEDDYIDVNTLPENPYK